jgi:hypothetical protein
LAVEARENDVEKTGSSSEPKVMAIGLNGPPTRADELTALCHIGTQ